MKANANYVSTEVYLAWQDSILTCRQVSSPVLITVTLIATQKPSVSLIISPNTSPADPSVGGSWADPAGEECALNVCKDHKAGPNLD